jgi:hypothetical protein
MRKKLFLFILSICITSFVFYAFQDGHRNQVLNSVKENGQNVTSVNKNPIKFTQSLTLDTGGSIPPLSNWYDYRTNGQNPHGLWVFGDTVLVACDMVDSAHAQVSTARNSYYTVSYNGGVSWVTPALQVSTFGNAYPDIDPIILTGARDVAMSGRQFVSGVRNGYVGVDVILGAGVLNSVLCGGQEIFTMTTSPTTIVGGFESKTTDSLFSIKFNAATTTYSGKVLLAVGTDGIAANSRTYSGASNNGYCATAWWDPAAGDMWCRISTDGGTTYAPKVHVLSSTQVINGESVCSWLSGDIIFSPSNNCGMAVATLSPGFFGFAQGSKIVFWSPAINGGNPVVIVDWHNAPSNCMLSDTVYYSNHYSSALDQVGMTALSHPSLAYSNDGTRLFCVYSVIQKDTASYGYFFNDICESYSTDNGATWSAPVKLTQTPQADEIYPIVARAGCTPTNIAVTWQLSECPGSYSFTNTSTPECPVHNIFKRFNPVTGVEIPIGIINVSSEIPSAFSLSQNYPNPFNPSTKIRFALPGAENVTIKVFNTLGQVVSTLVNNERLEAGIKEVTFDASNLSSGIYFYKITAGKFNQTKKMILVK